MTFVNLGRGLPDQGPGVTEHDLLAIIEAELAAASCRVPRLLVVDYYVALKTHQFVVLLGPEGHGKSELAHIFSQTLVGSQSDQTVSIQARPGRVGAGGEESFFTGLYERFSWIKFVEFLERAAAPENMGKPYFLCLEELSPLDVETYFTLLIQGDRPGEHRLAMPGYPQARWPIVPPNLFICGTVNADEHTVRFTDSVLGRVGPIEFRTGGLQPDQIRIGPIASPLVGLQRLMLAPAARTEEEARERLRALVGAERAEQLQPGPRLAGVLSQAGVALEPRDLSAIGRYLANSFDQGGRGLFVPQDPLRNYLLALDFQMARRALLRLRCSAPLETQLLIERYLDSLFAGSEWSGATGQLPESAALG
jgi:hypothetical protein